MLIGDVSEFCRDTALIWQFIGFILMIFKIVIPLLLLILGMFDLGKAVVASDDKAINKATTALVKRAVAAIIIFFIPTLIGFIFSIVAGFNDEIKDNYTVCKECVVSPTGNCKKCAKDNADNDECNKWIKTLKK